MTIISTESQSISVYSVDNADNTSDPIYISFFVEISNANTSDTSSDSSSSSTGITILNNNFKDMTGCAGNISILNFNNTLVIASNRFYADGYPADYIAIEKNNSISNHVMIDNFKYSSV